MRRVRSSASAANDPCSPSIDMWPIRRPVLPPVRVLIISSSRYSVPSNSTTSAQSIRSHIDAVTAGAAPRDNPEPRSPGAKLEPCDTVDLAQGVRIVPFKIERHLAGHGEQLRG